MTFRNVTAYLLRALQKAKDGSPLPLLELGRRVLLRHYSVCKTYYSYILKAQMDLRKTSILVYSSPKTGSSTIYRSLQALGQHMPIYHIHFLTHENIDELEKTYRESYPRIRRIPEALLRSQYLRKKMDKGLDVANWKIIAGVRDPIAQHISFFLYMIDVLLPPTIEYEYKISYLVPEDFARELIDLFLRDIETIHFAGSRYSVAWFDLELKRVFGLDACSTPFPKSKGYKMYRGDHPDILVFKLEALTKCGKEAFEKFLGIENFTLMKGNIADEGRYATVYEKFLDLITLPESYIDKMYDSRFVQHFYSREEIEAFKARWGRQDVLDHHT